MGAVETAKAIGIVANRTKASAERLTERLVALIRRQGAEALVEQELAAAIGRPELGIGGEEFGGRADMLFVLGGDGTLLGAARRYACRALPLLGINIGHLGFLSEAEPEDLDTAVHRVLQGGYFLERRLMIETAVHRGGREFHRGVGLNDAGVGKGSFARMIQVSVAVDGDEATAFAGDGLIVSTPTGSTAYSLSCGGPILLPHMQVMLITPICAHQLVARPFVIAGDQTVQIRVAADHRDIGLTVDGQVGFALVSGDEVVIRRADCDTILVRWKERAFFPILREKLRGD